MRTQSDCGMIRIKADKTGYSLIVSHIFDVSLTSSQCNANGFFIYILRSRSRSSTPAGIPRRQETGSKVKKEAGGRSTAPLQKRLAGVTQRSEGKRTSRDDKHRRR